jgi:hypothetical protein
MSLIVNIPPSTSGAVGPPALSVGSDVASATISTLSSGAAISGDTDGAYRIWGYIINNSGGAPVYTIRPNGVSANQVGQHTNVDTAVNATQRTDLTIATTGTTGATEPIFFEALLTSKSGVYRQWLCRARWKGTLYQIDLNHGEWQDTATVISSLVINSSVAAGVGAGSKFWVQAQGITGL